MGRTHVGGADVGVALVYDDHLGVQDALVNQLRPVDVAHLRRRGEHHRCTVHSPYGGDAVVCEPLRVEIGEERIGLLLHDADLDAALDVGIDERLVHGAAVVATEGGRAVGERPVEAVCELPS